MVRQYKCLFWAVIDPRHMLSMWYVSNRSDVVTMTPIPLYLLQNLIAKRVLDDDANCRSWKPL